MSITEEKIREGLSPELYTFENRQALFDLGSNAHDVIAGMKQIRNSKHSQLLTQEIFQALVHSGVNAYNLSLILVQMYLTDHRLITVQTCQLLGASGINAYYVGMLLIALNFTNPLLINLENCEILSNIGCNAFYVSRALGHFRHFKFTPTQTHFQKLLDAGSDAEKTAHDIIRRQRLLHYTSSSYNLLIRFINTLFRIQPVLHQICDAIAQKLELLRQTLSSRRPQILERPVYRPECRSFVDSSITSISTSIVEQPRDAIPLVLL